MRGTRSPSSAPIDAGRARRWAEKAAALAAPLLPLAGAAADPAPVVARGADDPVDWPYGRFMLTWLEHESDPRRIRHLPDGGFFLDVLDLSLRPVFERDTALRLALRDESRIEMAITNDVLQIQLRGLTAAQGYSMIRHHALMLFYAALWLEEPARGRWLGIFDGALSHLDAQPGGRPGADRLDRVERDGFALSLELAGASADDGEARRLLERPEELRAFLDYQLYASAAIGLLWRQYRRLAGSSRADWERRHLADGYLSPAYLLEDWRLQP